MPRRQYVVRLSREQRADLEQRIRTGTASARELTRCRILLKVDAAQPGGCWSDVRVADALEVHERTVSRVRTAFVQGGLERATKRQQPDRVYGRRLDGVAEAKLVELACGPVPDGQQRWSLRLLAEELVRLEIVEQIAPNTVRSALKKTSSSRGRYGNGCVPRSMS
jgi:Homeodomain-like domain